MDKKIEKELKDLGSTEEKVLFLYKQLNAEHQGLNEFEVEHKEHKEAVKQSRKKINDSKKKVNELEVALELELFQLSKERNSIVTINEIIAKDKMVSEGKVIPQDKNLLHTNTPNVN